MTFKVDSITQRLVFMPGVGLQEITTGKQIDQESPFDRHWNTLTMDRKNEKIAFNSTEAAMTPLSGDLPTVSGIRLFGRSSNTAQYIETGKVRIVDAALYEDDVKQHEFIPCRRKSDGVLGLYDVVGKRFYAKSEGCEEDFIPGPELHEEVRGLMILLR